MKKTSLIFLILSWSLVSKAIPPPEKAPELPNVKFQSAHITIKGTVYAVAVDSEHRKIIAGSFSTPKNSILRLNADGTLDSSFNVGSGFGGGPVYAIALQGDGKILVGGDFSSYNGLVEPRIVRLNSDGSLDGSFTGVGAGPDGTVDGIALQSSGKILVVGNFLNFNGSTQQYVARLTNTGLVDPFNMSNIGPSGTVYSVAVANGNSTRDYVYFGGHFNKYNTVDALGIVRTDSDGAVDTNFVSGTGVGTGTVYSIALETDGLLLGGNFSSYNGVKANNIVRTNTNGALDPSFNTAVSFNAPIRSVAVDSHGQILVGGDFTTVGSKSMGYVARLNRDGALDTNFRTEGGFVSSVKSLAVDPLSKVIVGGSTTGEVLLFLAQ